NIAARLGHTQFIQSAIRMTSIQDSNEYGNVKESAGVETTDSTSIDSLSFHLALILCVSGLSFLTTFFVQKLHIPLIEYIPEWGYAIIIMYIVWGGMQKA